MRELVVRGGSAKPLWAGHPWVHAASVEESGQDRCGDVAVVRDGTGRTIGWGFLSENSAIRVRLLAPGEPVDDVDAVLDERVRAACALRARLFPDPGRTSAYRLVHAEGDGLPGLIVDRLGDVLVAQFATGPMHRRREQLAERLLAESGASRLLSRPGGYEAEEGIPAEDATFQCGEIPDTVRVLEEGMTLELEPRLGQKTGHYADQRENRVRVAELCAGRTLLDLFAGTGGFGVQALRHGATSALAVETSTRACERARRTAALNDVSLEVVEADVRANLRELKAAGKTFDVVVCDPPNFHPRRGAASQAVKAYRDLNVQALTRVAPGGTFATFVCSARMRPAPWYDLVRSSARECRRRLRVLRELSAGPDHPVLAAAEEGRYLTGLLAVVDG